MTETVFLGRGAENVESALKLLSAEGVTIALDDFGTGYASLRHLKQFPVDIIKIDQSFVRGLDEDGDDAAIVQAVLKLSRSLDIKTVAEGIETTAQAEHLIRTRLRLRPGLPLLQGDRGDARACLPCLMARHQDLAPSRPGAGGLGSTF